ncbi:short-chain fatty acid transporter [Sedimentibacter sp. MB31-C6]|uniref:short-chain fatty acid transporter n=1 Tax=Sedimentibacter sp. MB31-C6 TaxID=3109366 RepID=UPI002DDC9F01|nr:short-chain fatty acid transporter [Sedimentibacter sp. MB36-C1]WSI05046.1 short-chain fatty acid transporter [Sedimentibacter sp. MB36-C1]
MFKKFTNGCVSVMNKYLPDPFLFAIILTIITFIGGIVVTDQSPFQMILHWAGSGGFWGLLAFSMQMVLVLVLGSAMAQAKFFKRLLKRIAKTAKTPIRGIMITSFISVVACWINWGFGLVIGALLAKEIAREVKGVDYRLLIASAYSGFIVWHGGISGSVPLKVANAGALSDVAPNVFDAAFTIPTSQTIFSPMNLVISAVIIIGLPFVCRAMMPDEEHTVVVDPSKLIEKEEVEEDKSKFSPADKLERSKIIWIITLIFGFTFIVYNFTQVGLNLSLDFVNFIFLFVGVLLHGSLRNYIDAIYDAASSAAGIILQFPFYAGIMGMMVGVNPETGLSLAGVISSSFVSISTVTTFPLFTFLSAGIVNFFVPSGGGQWAVQAPIMMPAGAEIGVDAAKTAMAIAWGDAWTNMIQPFWALPALGIAGLSAKDIMGYCVITLLFSGVVICAGFLIF